MTWIFPRFSASRWTDTASIWHRRGLWVCACVLFATAGTPLPAKQFQTPVSRTYKLQYRNTGEFLPLVQALLSRKGLVTASPELSIIVVTDLAANLTDIDSLVAVNDRPRRQVRMVVQLIAGRNTENPDDGRLSAMARTLIEDADYHFNNYELFDSGVILTASGNSTSLELAGGMYGLAFTPEFVPGETDIIQVQGFNLELRQRSLGRTTSRSLLATSFSLPNGAIELIGAAQLGREDETLILIVHAAGM